MKKALLTFAFVFTSFLAMQAQVWLGGSVSATLSKDLKTFTFTPDVGYYFTDTPFSLGCGIAYCGTFQQGETYTHSLTVSPFFRYDICNIEERFSLFVDLYSDIDALEFSFFDIGLAPGVSFDLTEQWSAEFSYGFVSYYWEQVPGQEIEHGFELDFKAAAAEFGIYYSF